MACTAYKSKILAFPMYSHRLRATSYAGLPWCILVITLQALPYLLIVEQQLLFHVGTSQHMILSDVGLPIGSFM